MKNITTINYNGEQINSKNVKGLIERNSNENGITWMVYEITDTTNGNIYVGKKKVRFACDILSYTGSGTILKHFQKKHGLKNFKMEILSFFDNSLDSRLEEARIVNYDFINRFDTYNVAPGGSELPAQDTDAIYHCPKTNKMLNGYICQEAKFNSFGFKKGLSDKMKNKIYFCTPEGRRFISEQTRKIGMIYNKEHINVKNEEVQSYLENGAVFASTRIFLHLPNPAGIYVRGDNLTQPVANNPERILKMIEDGWVIGTPSVI